MLGGRDLLARKAIEQCAVDFKRLAVLKPDQSPPWTMAGLCEYHLRHYDTALANLIRAQQAGFTLSEIRELFFGFAAGTHPNARWEALAQRKLSELEEQLARIHAMQSLLREGMRCHCLTIEQCTVWLSGLEPTV